MVAGVKGVTDGTQQWVHIPLLNQVVAGAQAASSTEDFIHSNCTRA